MLFAFHKVTDSSTVLLNHEFLVALELYAAFSLLSFHTKSELNVFVFELVLPFETVRNGEI